jgi:ABC-type spermidine/putrescine transport system permease subunit II
LTPGCDFDVRTLTEAALSLGASWPAVIVRVIVPNLVSSLLTGALLTFALVMGELTLAQYLGWPRSGHTWRSWGRTVPTSRLPSRSSVSF